MTSVHFSFARHIVYHLQKKTPLRAKSSRLIPDYYLQKQDIF